MATHSSTIAWKIPWTEEPGRLQSMGSLRVRHDRATSLSLLTFMHWRKKWQPTPVFLPGESVGCHLWGCRVGHDWSDLAAAAAGQVFCIMSFYWDLTNVFLTIRLGLWVLQRKITKVKCNFHILSKIHTINMAYQSGCWPWSADQGNVCQLSPLYRYSFFPPFHMVFFERKSHIHYTLAKPNEWGITLHLFEGSVST